METSEALKILTVTLRSMRPNTGELLPERNQFSDLDIVRALHLAVQVLASQLEVEVRKK